MSKEEIMKRTDLGFKVYAHFIPEVKLKKKFLSPFRGEKDPSFNLFIHRQLNEIWFKDFAGGIEMTGNCIKFVAIMKNCEYTEAKRYIEENVLNEINVIGDRELYDSKREILLEKSKKQLKIVPVIKEWSPAELAWWRKFGITKEVLESFYVSSLSKYYMETNEGMKEYVASHSNPIYCIGINDRFKLYRPLGDRKFKWRSNLNGEQDVFGWHLLPSRSVHGKLACCFILAGNKDVMSFHAMTGLPAIAFNSETAFIPKLHELSLKHHFERVFILYDNDREGWKSAAKIGNATGFTVINDLLDIAPDVKDFAEMVEKRPECLPEFMEELKSILINNQTE